MAAVGAADVVTCGIVSRQLLKLQLWYATEHLEDGKETQSAIACTINRVSPNPQHPMHPTASSNLERKKRPINSLLNNKAETAATPLLPPLLDADMISMN